MAFYYIFLQHYNSKYTTVKHNDRRRSNNSLVQKTVLTDAISQLQHQPYISVRHMYTASSAQMTVQNNINTAA